MRKVADRMWSDGSSDCPRVWTPRSRGGARALVAPCALALTYSLAAACSVGPSEHEAFLTVVGDTNGRLERGSDIELEVRYHDRDGQPLHGRVSFSIGESEGAGVALSHESATTDEGGTARVVVSAARDVEGSFSVEARAAGAQPVHWLVSAQLPRRLNGDYVAESRVDVVSGIEGKVGDVVSAVLQLTTEPGTYLLRRIAGATGLIDDQDAERFGPVLTILIEEHAPDLVGDVLALGDLLDDNLRDFGLVSQLAIRGEPGAQTLDHVLTGVRFRHDGGERTVTLADLGQDEIDVRHIALAVDERAGRMQISTHRMPLSMGAMITIGIEEILLPSIDERAEDLRDFLLARIPCDEVARRVVDRFDVLDERHRDTLEAACTAAVSLVAGEIMREIENLDETGLALIIEGEAELQQRGDAAALVGSWEGVLDYGGAAAAAFDARSATFTAERID